MAEPNASINSFFIEGPAGRLEALLNAGSPDAKYAALVCHPHPLYGGTMHNKVVYHAAKALNSFGFPVLRFNFRGAGLSEGEHAHGRGEIDDVRAALHWLTSKFNRPIVFAGFSFGASTGMRACCPDPDVKFLISLGTPVAAEGRVYAYKFLADCPKPKLFVSGDSDPYGPVSELQRVEHNAAPPKKLVIVPNAGHFFEGQLPVMRHTIEQWIRENVLPELKTA
ncbi:MAG TPA: alpha/beta fold hydrolase [Terriglobales bacterium]|nr:alpha/beta fold hydrolase [Terriglobales bacterium]